MSGLALFISAAIWQWRRAEYKDQRQQEFESARQSTTVALEAALHTPERKKFQFVRARGQLDTSRLLFFENQVRGHRLGIEVFAMLVTESGHKILIDLGWIASDPAREKLPVLPMFSNQLDASGLLVDMPAPGLKLGNENDTVEQSFPRWLTRIEPETIRKILATADLQDRMVKLAPDAQSGFERELQLSGLSADKHRGYALQWISFALAAIVIFLVLHKRRRGEVHDSKES